MRRNLAFIAVVVCFLVSLAAGLSAREREAERGRPAWAWSYEDFERLEIPDFELLRAAAGRQPTPSLDTQLGLALAAGGEQEAARAALARALGVEDFAGRADAEAALARLGSGDAGEPDPTR